MLELENPDIVAARIAVDPKIVGKTAPAAAGRGSRVATTTASAAGRGRGKRPASAFEDANPLVGLEEVEVKRRKTAAAIISANKKAAAGIKFSYYHCGDRILS